MLLVGIAIILVALGVATVLSTENLSQFGARPRGARLERMRRSPNHDGKRFINPLETHVALRGSYLDMIGRWLFGRQVREPERSLPVVHLNREACASAPPAGLRITWLGHATVLVEIDGRRILTDPVWSYRCSPSTLAGPRRFHPPPLPLDELPALDLVLISHDHFDHLEKHSVIELARTGVPFVMPLGVGAHLERWGIDPDQIVELDWWESCRPCRNGPGDLEIVATPARHFSGRGPNLRGNATLWASWAFIGQEHRVFFSGDTGPFPGLAEIGEKQGPFDVALIKIGAYGRWWPDIHLNPEQALDAHLALRAKLLIPIHWGTFNLALHDWFEPPERLLAAAASRADSGQPVLIAIPRPGQGVSPASPPELERWWRQ